MKRILVDMDGVLADVYSRFFDLHEEETGERKILKNIIGMKESEAFPGVMRWVNTPGFFRSIPVMPESQRVLGLLNNTYEIVIVSMATEFAVSLTDKQLWLQDHFPFISWKQVVFCGNKNLVKADIMIDDHFKNLDNFPGEKLLYIQPHNMNNTTHGYKTLKSWPDIEKFLL